MNEIREENRQKITIGFIVVISACVLVMGWFGGADAGSMAENRTIMASSAISNLFESHLAGPLTALRSSLPRSHEQWQALLAPAGTRPSANALSATSVQALFELNQNFLQTQGEPYPTDLLMVPDSSQNTGKQLVLAFSFELDGFPVQPRLSIPFSGPIDPSSVNSKDVFLVSLGSTLPGGPPPGQIIGINQVVWEVAANTLHAESNDLLDQHSRYALVVTNGIRDTKGNPVQASDAFTNFRANLLGQQSDPALKAYGQELSDGLGQALDAAGIPAKSVVAASVFTTRSVTATLEKIRAQIDAATPAPADFLIGPGGTRAVFNFSDISLCPGPTPTSPCGVTFNLQFGDNASDPASFASFDTFLEFLPLFFPVGQVAYGRFTSPNYINSDVVLPPIPSRTGVPAVLGTNVIYFTLILPSGPKPPNGWPVVIYGHGSGESKDAGSPPFISGVLPANGFAVIVITAAGFGWGPASTVSITKNDGTTVTIPAPGRSFDMNGDGIIDTGEGSFSDSPLGAFNRDSNQQTAADWMQLVRVIQVGIDVDGDGKPDLDPSRIYHLGASLGGIQGTTFDAVEPGVHAAVINSAGSPLIDQLRLGAFTGPTYTFILGLSSLLNGPGGTFIDNTPLRNQPPVIDDVPGASAIQAFNDAVAWLMSPGEPVPYAQHLRKQLLAGVGPKAVIVQFAKGDKIVPNPLETALVRAGGLADRTTYFRNDLFFQIDPTGAVEGEYPHTFLFELADQNTSQVANDVQQQVAVFFASDGTNIVSPQTIDPTLPAGLFEVPIVPPLPEGLNYIF